MNIFSLVFAIVTCVGFICAIAIWCKWLADDPVNETAGQSFSVLSIALAFDPDHAILWDTQVSALALVSSAGKRGLSLRRLRRWHCESARHYPELYEGYTFYEWLKFLLEAQLVAYHSRRLVLTPQGSDFLHYRVPVHHDLAVVSAPHGA